MYTPMATSCLSSEVVSLSFRTPTLALLPLGMLPSVLYSISTGSRKSALLTDILALSFSHNALSILKLDSFRTGCILLSGLFVYDIYWVFGTEVVRGIVREQGPVSFTTDGESGQLS